MSTMASPRLARILFLNCRVFPSSVSFQRNYGGLPSVYDAEDPAPLFFSPVVQSSLKYLTRPDPSKIFRKRTHYGDRTPPTPEYKFLTDKQLHEEMVKSRERADRMLQMPPVVKIQTQTEKIVSQDPALVGYDTAKYVFTDITYGLNKNDRIIVVRDTDGNLKHVDYDVKKRLIQTYFPMDGRSLKEPSMLTEEKLLNRLLENKKYEFILDRACLQYDPDEQSYQCIGSKVYQSCDSNVDYDLLRSTRHFGPMTFYLSWHNAIDGLMLELLQGGALREATVLVNLKHYIHPNPVKKDESNNLVDEILNTKDFWGKTDPNRFGDADIALDERCFLCIDSYIKNNSTRRGQHELAYQALREFHQKRISQEKGIRVAHGAA